VRQEDPKWLVREVYWSTHDPGVHAAAERLLRRWRLEILLRHTPEVLRRFLPPAGEVTKSRWYVNGQGQTFAVIPAPGPFDIGSPPKVNPAMSRAGVWGLAHPG
jgi:hypothetical protein